MRHRQSPEAVARLLAAVQGGASVRSAARASGIHAATASRIVAASRAGDVTPAGAYGAPQYPPSAPYGGDMIPPGRADIPPPAWGADQPVPPPTPLRWREGYHDRTFRAYSAPLAFEGWSVERMRNAIAVHDNGVFLESSLLALTSLRFGPVIAAMSQRIAPILSLPRHIRGGLRGVSRILAAEVEAQLVPRAGLLPSPYFPETIWGSVAADRALMGFAVLQHTYGEPDPETGVRPVYTRRWPTWAVQYYRYRRTYVAVTNEGPIDIVSGDGKFTLIADEEEPHFSGAIRALGVEVLDGMLAKQARAHYIDLYGNPKLVGTMPTGTGVRTPEGDDFFHALQDVRNPDGIMVLPAGAKLDFVKLSGETSGVFKDALESVWAYVAAIILGSDGTLSRGTGVYSAPIFAGVRRDLIARDLASVVRAANQGHVYPWLSFNFAQTIIAAKSAGEWTEPVLDIPLPDPDADARVKSQADRLAALVAQMQAERAAGCDVTQERIEQLAAAFDVVSPPVLAPKAAVPAARLDLAPTDLARVVRVDEARASQGLAPIGDDRGALTIGELEKPLTAPQEGPVEAPAEDNPGPITQPLDNAAAAKLAAEMTAHQIERCEHGKTNRCPLCGIERERVLLPPSTPCAGDHAWGIKWTPIGGEVPPAEPEAPPADTVDAEPGAIGVVDKARDLPAPLQPTLP